MQLSVLKQYFYAYVRNLTTDKLVGSTQKDMNRYDLKGSCFNLREVHWTVESNIHSHVVPFNFCIMIIIIKNSKYLWGLRFYICVCVCVCTRVCVCMCVYVCAYKEHQW